MAKVVWVCAWIAVAIWSLLCWLAFGLIDVASGLASGSSGMLSELLPGSESLLRGLVDLADDVGEFLLFLIWVGVSGLILGGAWVVGQFLGGPRATPGWSGVHRPDAFDQPLLGADTAMGARRSQSAMVDAALKRFGVGGGKIGSLKRLPGQDHWRA
jgi:hypothetical protein